MRKLILLLITILLCSCSTTKTIVSAGASQVRDDISLLQHLQTDTSLLVEQIKEEHKELSQSLKEDSQIERASLISEHIELLEEELLEQRQYTQILTEDLSVYEQKVLESETEKALAYEKIDKLITINNRYKLLIIILTFILILIIILITTTPFLRK